MCLQIPGRGIDLRILLQGAWLTCPDTFSAEIAAAGPEIEYGITPPAFFYEPFGTGGDAVTTAGALFQESVLGCRPRGTNDCPSTIQVAGQELHSAYVAWHITRVDKIQTEPI